jgi:hypothetical protein
LMGTGAHPARPKSSRPCPQPCERARPGVLADKHRGLSSSIITETQTTLGKSH